MSAYSEATIYFLSGTGNSYRAATWLGAAAQRQGLATRVTPITQAQPSAEVRDDPAALGYYLAFTVLLRVPLLNRLLTASTLTHYYRRYHDAETTLTKLR
jgi:hypothetical protein